MSQGINSWVGVGNLADDPRVSRGNGPVILRLAIGREQVNKEGTRTELTDYVSINVWGKRGEALAKVLKKGEAIAVQGFLSTHSWEDENGQKQYQLTITATNVTLRGKAK